MKLLPLLLVATMAPLPAFARYQQPGYSNQCFRNVYREQYVPGTSERPGYVRRWRERKEVPCYNAGADGYYTPQPRPPRNPHYLPADPPRHHGGHVDDNSCIEGSIIGGIAGGAIGGAAATQENWIWSIPAGIVGGALVGCQVDGG